MISSLHYLLRDNSDYNNKAKAIDTRASTLSIFFDSKSYLLYILNDKYLHEADNIYSG
jgi:hypothetical protein